MAGTSHRILAIAYAITALTDALTTIIGLEVVGLVERNALPAAVYAAAGPAGIVLLAITSTAVVVGLTTVLWALDRLHSRTVALCVLGAGIGVKGLATAWNLLLFV